MRGCYEAPDVGQFVEFADAGGSGYLLWAVCVMAVFSVQPNRRRRALFFDCFPPLQHTVKNRQRIAVWLDNACLGYKNHSIIL